MHWLICLLSLCKKESQLQSKRTDFSQEKSRKSQKKVKKIDFSLTFLDWNPIFLTVTDFLFYRGWGARPQLQQWSTYKPRQHTDGTGTHGWWGWWGVLDGTHFWWLQGYSQGWWTWHRHRDRVVSDCYGTANVVSDILIDYHICPDIWAVASKPPRPKTYKANWCRPWEV